MAEAAATPAAPRKANLVVTIGALTVLAVVGGGIVGKFLAGRLTAQQRPADVIASAQPYAGDTEVRELPALVTNLADPPDARVRIQVSIVFKKKAVENPTVLEAKINEDLMAFLKTCSLGSLQGASGLENLRADLQDRAAVRSDGKVSEVMIETLVIQ